MARDGGNETLRGRVICPFFERHAEQKRAIICEGLTTSCESSMMFESKLEMIKHSEKYCETYHYGCCPMAMAIARKHVEQDIKAGRY